MKRRTFLGALAALVAGRFLNFPKKQEPPNPFEAIAGTTFETWKPTRPSGRDAYEAVFRTYWQVGGYRPEQLELGL